VGRNVRGANCPWGEMSMGRDVVGRVVVGRVVLGRVVLGRVVLGRVVRELKNLHSRENPLNCVLKIPNVIESSDIFTKSLHYWKKPVVWKHLCYYENRILPKKGPDLLKSRVVLVLAPLVPVLHKVFFSNEIFMSYHRSLHFNLNTAT
jgi:hypothetical protein